MHVSKRTVSLIPPSPAPPALLPDLGQAHRSAVKANPAPNPLNGNSRQAGGFVPTSLPRTELPGFWFTDGETEAQDTDRVFPSFPISPPCLDWACLFPQALRARLCLPLCRSWLQASTRGAAVAGLVAQRVVPGRGRPFPLGEALMRPSGSLKMPLVTPWDKPQRFPASRGAAAG